MCITETGTCFCNKNSPYGIITQGIFHVVYPSMNCNHFHSRRNAMAKCLHCLVSFSSTTLNVPNIWHVSIYLLICINSLEKLFHTANLYILVSEINIKTVNTLESSKMHTFIKHCDHQLYTPPPKKKIKKSTLFMIKALFHTL